MPPTSLRDRLLLCLWIAATALAGAAQDDGGSYVRRLERWHAAWRDGRLPLASGAAASDVARRLYGSALVDEAPQVLASHRAGLVELLARVALDPGQDGVDLVLRLAATGLGKEPLDPGLQADFVRETAQLALARTTGSTALERLRAAARGERKGFPGWEPELQLAALQALGAVRNQIVRLDLEAQLAAGDDDVRTAAAGALGVRAHANSTGALATALPRETDTPAALAMLDALHAIVLANAATLDARSSRDALAAALASLGRFDWRCDLVVVELCRRIRSARSIAPLIAVLERCADARSGHDKFRSGTLREAAHRALRELTGTLFAADRPQDWRAFWDRERDAFVMPPPPGSSLDDTRTSSGFFGIPVRGLRVLFVIDVSGSMDESLLVPRDNGTSSAEQVETTTRIAQAKVELWNAVEALPADARFGVIAFSDGVRRWGKPLVPATDRGRASLRDLLRSLAAGGSTNLYGALDAALDIADTRFGQDVDAEIDELFVLSDGQPSSGELTDPEAILAAVARANRVRRVRIHTVALGGASEFVRRLAEENGGVCAVR
ncbi:MAG: VWA domain-containing protein [Planctomycetes bacterium]|nr:VWA domain-containing protein [Planctomycetota bacterium]